ncbi:helix-turn-helix domain-containing protein [Streptomyces lunaelactis]|uniref:helix-turn-helix transcriptional regulator n=1 Tax=Streptomyces lunaelactis TaxID=1535768 RepID=UPI0015852AFB|nr:helix-turn-helix transcriptional regulator [Streptomyces lunaelactis]NUK33249.1 helix-turn-helix domain-containing protein [Streptomyces lunaelactis]NUK39678.1 helix-turn-helix domain-containing protein [Streptomyces lunaelactis]NUK49044.1 helix-turn-helix domain-containing protein [Streptomyces lunaelactis]NUK62869.1 helix-turn-helix domain-containing protein [Streptomyces lunaelactis]NUK78105.1 helix-turn-helix domain-containing protein [Streptomyces lunaelactis]
MYNDTRPDSVEGLGQFLRSHRERISPADAGLPSAGRRRVPGLRRDEVAALAGVSLSYYSRLEQGRELSPSLRVLEAMARGLRLGEEDERELFRLAQPAARRRTKSPFRVERVRPHLRQLIESWTRTPAFIIGHAQDLLATNALADALYRDFARHDNVLRMLFLDPAAKSFYKNAERAKHRAVADLQRTAASTPEDPRILELVGELSVRSGEFRSLWAREYSRVPPYDVKQMYHSGVGDLELRHEALNIRSAPGQQLVILQAEPGSPSADGLALLGSINTPEVPHQQNPAHGA